jgi:hypothetical protein
MASDCAIALVERIVANKNNGKKPHINTPVVMSILEI